MKKFSLLRGSSSNVNCRGSWARPTRVWTRSLAYRRVCLRTDEDLARLPVLISTFLRDPTTTSRLKEIIIDRPSYGNWSQPPSDGINPLSRCIEYLEFPEDVTDTIRNIAINRKSKILPESVLETFRRHIQSANKSQSYVCPHAGAAVLFALAPDIQTLRIQEFDLTSPLHHFLRFNNYAHPSTQALTNLKHLHLGPDPYDFRADERFYQPLDIFRLLSYFHRLPNVSSVNLEGITDHPRGFDDNVPLLPAHLSPNLKSITITHSSMSSTGLAALIRLPKPNVLQSFQASIGGLAIDDDGAGPRFYTQTIRKALETQKFSLRSLELDMEEYIYPRQPDEHEATNSEKWYAEYLGQLREDPHFVRDERDSGVSVWPFDLPRISGGLRDFAELESLRIGVNMLFDMVMDKSGTNVVSPPRTLVDLLPYSLKSLTLLGYRRGVNPEHDRQIQELADLKGERLPELAEVTGINQYVPAAENEGDPDANYENLWRQLPWDGNWDAD